jgi:hypothetical protein
VLVFSTTKGISALTVAVAHSRGLLDYDEKVATYWPEFAQSGKEDVTCQRASGPSSRAVRDRRTLKPGSASGSRPPGGATG